MKQTLIPLLVVLSLVVMVPRASAWYYAVGGGSNSDDGHSFSLEAGLEDIRWKERPFLLGLIVPVIHYGDRNLPTGLRDEPCPHANCSDEGDEYEGNEAGFMGRAGMQLFHPKTYVSLLAGVTWVDTVEIDRSNVSGEFFTRSTDTETKPVYGIGLSCFPEFFEWKLKMLFSLDIDNRRGVSGTVGWRW